VIRSEEDVVVPGGLEQLVGFSHGDFTWRFT
jgi:hypothetical protein